MLKQYVTVALRTFRKQPGTTLIHVLGLAVGIACCMLMGRYVYHAWSYDRFHEEADALHRVTQTRRFGTVQRTAVTPPPLGPALQREFPAVEAYVRFVRQSVTVRHNGDAFFDQAVVTADSSFFSVFSFSLQRGTAATVLAAPFSVVLTESAAERYFGDADPIGQSVTLHGNGAPRTYTVTGVVADVPANSHVQFDAVASLSTMQKTAPQFFHWGANMFWTYVRLADGASPAALEARFDAFVEQHFGEEYVGTIEFALQPLTDIHLHSDLTMDFGGRGSATLVYVLAVIAVLVLVVAGINFVNLATARATERAREVGMRKVVGARRWMIVGQFLTEAIVVALAATGGAVLLAWIALPLLNALTGQAFTGAVLTKPMVWAGLLGVALGVGLGAGSYPAFVLARFQPASALQAGAVGDAGGKRLRQGLAVFQFAVAIGLIAATIVAYQQFEYIRAKDLGFDADRVVSVRTPQGAAQVERLQTLWQSVEGVEAVTAVSQWIGDLPTRTVRPDSSAETSLAVRFFDAAPNFTEAMNMRVIAGRSFHQARATDTLDAALINRAAAHALGWRPASEAVGKQVFTEGTGWRVIGVVDDFHYSALYSEVDPLLIRARPSELWRVLVRLQPGQAEAGRGVLEAGWQAVVPGRPFNPAFVTDQRAQLYQSDRRLGRFVGVLAAMAVCLACLGLFGLAAHTAAQRTKEIGVRKVLGATVSQVVLLLSTEYLKLIGVALVLAVPVTYLALRRWLAGFAYRTELGAGVFLLAGGVALAVALLAVSAQTFRAATADPVNALRHE